MQDAQFPAMVTCHSLADSATAEVQDLLPPLVVKEEVERPDIAILSCSAPSIPSQGLFHLQSMHLWQLDAGKATAQEYLHVTGTGDILPSKWPDRSPKGSLSSSAL